MSESYISSDIMAGFDQRSADRTILTLPASHSTGEFPGKGIGLATVRRIIQSMAGKLWLKASRKGCDVLFHLESGRWEYGT